MVRPPSERPDSATDSARWRDLGERVLPRGAAAWLVGAVLCCACGTLTAADSPPDAGSADGSGPERPGGSGPKDEGDEPSAGGADPDPPGSPDSGVTPTTGGSDQTPQREDHESDDVPESGEELPLPSDPSDFTRLTRAEYRATVEAAFGVLPELNLLPEDGRIGSFTSNASVTPDPVHPYLVAAEALADVIVAADYPTCDSSTARACLEEGYSKAVERLYRRPVSPAEVTGWAGTWQSVRDAGGSAEQATRAVLSAILVGPDFLYRSAPALSDGASGRRGAERLSYALWDAPPDEELLAAVEADASASTLAEQAGRLGADERAVAVLARFVGQWLHVDTDLRLEQASFADSPQYQELLAIVRRALSEGTPVTDLVAGRVAAVHEGNADFYGVQRPDPDGGDVAFLSWDEDDPRRGLLAQDLFISSTRHPDVGRREIFRGLLVRRELLCDAIPAPSADLVALAGEVGERTEDVRCAGCHHLIDPVGEAFAVLDDDLEQPASTAQILAHAELEGSYESVAQLLEAVAGSRAFASCFSRHWLSFFLERSETQLDAEWVQELADSVHAGASLRAVIEQTAARLFIQTEETIPWCSGQ